MFVLIVMSFSFIITCQYPLQPSRSILYKQTSLIFFFFWSPQLHNLFILVIPNSFQDISDGIIAICVLGLGCNYSWPLNNSGVRGDDLLTVKIPCMTLQSALHVAVVHPRIQSTIGSRSTIVDIYWKKSTYKWTHAVPTHVVQGSTVLECSLFKFEDCVFFIAASPAVPSTLAETY